MSKLLPVLFLVLFSCSQKKQDPEPEKQKTPPTKVLLKQPNYQVEYYGDWSIDSGSLGSHALQLNAPSKSSFASVLSFGKSIDEKQYVQQQVANFVPGSIKEAVVTGFTQMGSYTGYGQKIEGYLEFKKIEVKIFAARQDTLSFALMTQLFDGSRKTDEPGLQLIESSFKMNK